MDRKRSTVGAVLAGGASRRFGRPKAHALLAGRSLAEWVLDAHRRAGIDSCVVTNDPSAFKGLSAPTIPDLHPGRGPAAGIHAGLHWASARGAAGLWVSPVDAPLVDPTLLDRLLELTSDAQAVIPRSRGPLGLEPLFGWYSVEALPIFSAALREEAPAMHELLGRLARVELLPLGPSSSERCFRNVNTLADLHGLADELTNLER